MIKIDLITGFLGSGKTTFIKKYADQLTKKGCKTGILENDYGAVNVDMMLLGELQSDNCVIETVAGACDAHCHKRRFKTKLISLAMSGCSRVIIEPSGIFDVDEFFDVLHEEPLDRWYEAGSVITIVDAKLENDLSEQSEYLLASQAANAGKIIISKTSQAQPEDIKNTVEHLNKALEKFRCKRRLKSCDIITKDWESFSEEDFEAISNSGYIPESYVKVLSENTDYSSFYYLHVKATPDELKEIAERILKECMGVFRIKGFVKQDDSWFELNAAKGNVEVSPICNGQEIIIVIGENMEKNQIDKFFE
ncbi:MAG: GTP-binding protein [Clostridia bacterium]|nr:GTP-binding protein [Clostridia bacterium]